MTAAYRLILRTLATKGRLAAVGAAGLVLVMLAGVARVNGSGAAAAVDLIDVAGFLLLVPVAALLFGSSAFGEPAEDGNLPYLTLRPLARWRLVVAGMLAAMTVAFPLAVVPLVLVGLIAGTSASLIVAVVAATALGVCAYGSIFVALGIRSRRALFWGLAYVILWEGVVAAVSQQLGRTAIRTHVRSLFDAMTRGHVEGFTVAGSTAVLVMVAITLVGVALATRFLSRIDLE
ncbi:MAG: hypothetical protein LC789_18675 [Actinobacteria bacterium]|nr:hypothetical protein [Actinomycetota bacterium]